MVAALLASGLGSGCDRDRSYPPAQVRSPPASPVHFVLELPHEATQVRAVAQYQSANFAECERTRSLRGGSKPVSFQRATLAVRRRVTTFDTVAYGQYFLPQRHWDELPSCEWQLGTIWFEFQLDGRSYRVFAETGADGFPYGLFHRECFRKGDRPRGSYDCVRRPKSYPNSAWFPVAISRAPPDERAGEP